MSARTPEAEPLLTPAEVATMFRVDPKTVTRWAKAGKLTSIRTLGGHRRYRETEVRALLAGIPQQRRGDLLPSWPGGARQAPLRVNAAALDQGNGGSAPVAECHIEGLSGRDIATPGTSEKARCRGRSALRGGSHDA